MDGIAGKQIVSGVNYIGVAVTNVSISNVISSVRIPHGKPTTSPPLCSSISENGLFCVNSKTGDLFTTTRITEFFLHSEHFNITLSFSLSINKEIKAKITIKLNIVDPCAAARKPYFELNREQCTSFSRILPTNQLLPPWVPSNPTQMVFQYIRKSKSQHALGVRISGPSFFKPKSLFKLIVTITGKSNEKHTFPIPYTNDSVVYVPIYPVEEIDLRIQLIFQITIDTGDNFVSFTKNDGITVFYSQSWDECRKEKCVDLYKQWKSNTSLSKDPKCKKDDQFVEPYFNRCTSIIYFLFSLKKHLSSSKFAYLFLYFINIIFWCSERITKKEKDILDILSESNILDCTIPLFLIYSFTDLKPVFLTSPSYSNEVIQGCQYTSILGFNKKNFYLLINGERREFPGEESSTQYRIRSNDDVGEVQCALYDPLRMKSPVLSNVTRVPILGW